MINRRTFLTGLMILLGMGVAPLVVAEVTPRRRRRVRRRTRRRVRRRVAWRTVGGRPWLVVPLTVAVGWELLVDDRVVVVTEVHEHHVLVEHADGKNEKIDVIREDTAANSAELDGTEYEVDGDG